MSFSFSLQRSSVAHTYTHIHIHTGGEGYSFPFVPFSTTIHLLTYLRTAIRRIPYAAVSNPCIPSPLAARARETHCQLPHADVGARCGRLFVMISVFAAAAAAAANASLPVSSFVVVNLATRCFISLRFHAKNALQFHRVFSLCLTLGEEGR